MSIFTATASLRSINRLLFITETGSVYSAVRVRLMLVIIKMSMGHWWMPHILFGLHADRTRKNGYVRELPNKKCSFGNQEKLDSKVFFF
jgi:hypothetical protein